MQNAQVVPAASMRLRRGILLTPLQIPNNHQQGPQPPPLRILSNQAARDNLLGLINNPQYGIVL